MAKPIWITNWNLGTLENLTPISVELVAKPVTPAISVTYSLVSGSLPTGTTLSQVVYRDWETDRKSTRLNSSHRL